MASLSNRPLLVDVDWNYLTRDFFPSGFRLVDVDWYYLTRDFFPLGFRLDDLQSLARAGPSTIPAFKLPARTAPFGPQPTIVWPDPGTIRATVSFRLPTDYVKGSPHPSPVVASNPPTKLNSSRAINTILFFMAMRSGYSSRGVCARYALATIPV